MKEEEIILDSIKNFEKLLEIESDKIKDKLNKFFEKEYAINKVSGLENFILGNFSFEIHVDNIELNIDICDYDYCFYSEFHSNFKEENLFRKYEHIILAIDSCICDKISSAQGIVEYFISKEFECYYETITKLKNILNSFPNLNGTMN